APHHFEANELNYINGKYVYTYNTDWQDHSDWPYEGEVPTICSMCYMTSEPPLDAASWQYGRSYLKNSGDYGYTYTNNHTHLHKYNDKWYIFYHSMELQKDFDTEGGFRNVCVDEIEVDEDKVEIKMADQSLKGVAQIRPLNPFIIQQAETTAATKGVRFEAASDGKPGNMVVSPCNEEGIILVRGVKFDKVPQQCAIAAEGNGEIEIRKDAADGELIASVTVSKSTSNNIGTISEKMGLTFDNIRGISDNIVTVNSEAITHSDVSEAIKPYDLYFILKGNELKFDSWQFR
ncbi:MAG: carbohydrate-binding protein, partial [Muribaculaceae bacterium]|nr:carbohydrate-binding protein [Muribaculaceae bacterium]